MITPLNLLTVFTGMKTTQKNRKDAILAADLELRNKIKSTAYEYGLKADIEKLKADIASSADNADMFSEKLVYENSENPSMNYNFGIPKFYTGDKKASLEKEALLAPINIIEATDPPKIEFALKASTTIKDKLGIIIL